MSAAYSSVLPDTPNSPTHPMKNKPVLITTKHRGVFFGYLESRDDTGGAVSVVLTAARCAIRFGTEGGFLELARSGPTGESKIGSPAERLELFDVTSIADVTAEVATTWEKHGK